MTDKPSPFPESSPPPPEPARSPAHLSTDTVLIPVPPNLVMEIEKMLQLMNKYRASDLLIKVGAQPAFRVAGKLRPLDLKPLAPDFPGEQADAMEDFK